MWSQIEAWWEQRTQREQGLLLIAMGLLVSLLFYMVLWRPVHGEHQRAQKRLDAARQQWQWLNEQVRQHPELLQRPQPQMSMERLRQWLEALNRSLGLNAQVQQVDDRVVLRFKSAPSMAVVGLLNRLQQAPVKVVKMRLSSSQGRVQGEVEVRP